MKKLAAIACIFFALHTLHAQPYNRTFERLNGSIDLLGRVTLDRLMQEPFDSWFSDSYENYTVDSATLGSVVVPDSITIFLGTWCGDSRREVPRFIKLLEQINYDLENVEIICLNKGFQNYKQAPEREERGMNIHRVPTFILHDANQNELGRIVEEPVVSLEQDLVDIMYGRNYETHYPVANDLIQKFSEEPVNKLRKMIPELKKVYLAKSEDEYELNTYGYVLWTSFDLVKAELVFELNHLLYPSSPRTVNSLARFKANIGKQKEAWKYLNAGIRINPEDEGLQKLSNNWKEKGF